MIPPEAREGTRRDVATRVCLVLASVLLALLLCEAALRVLFPKYRDTAEGRLQPDDMRIYAPVPNSREWRVHPDTGRSHPFHHNNLGLRQHRNFTAVDLATATTVGVFGDSFVRGSYLDAPYVFTEPLDYLLNLDGDFTVLNFGVGGYGPAQSYFAYRSFHARGDLDYVLFVYYANNDIRDLVHNRLFDLDDGGRLRQREARGRAWWVPVASRLHLTYLALDASGRLKPYVLGISEDLQAARYTWVFGDIKFTDDLWDYGLEVFGQLLRRWRREVEESGSRFFVVLLPTQRDFPWVRPLLLEAGVGLIDLNACYASYDDGHRERDWRESPYRFVSDGHWNELGNRLAAACLNERLRREAGLPAMTEAARDAALAEYYAAFESPRPGQRAGIPLARESQPGSAGTVAGSAVPHMNDEASRFEARRRIRRKYQALGDFDAAEIAGIDPHAPPPPPPSRPLGSLRRVFRRCTASLRQGELPCGRRLGEPSRACDSGRRQHSAAELELFRPASHSSSAQRARVHRQIRFAEMDPLVPHLCRSTTY